MRSDPESDEFSAAEVPKLRSVHSASSISLGGSSTSELTPTCDSFLNSILSGVAGSVVLLKVCPEGRLAEDTAAAEDATTEALEGVRETGNA